MSIDQLKISIVAKSLCLPSTSKYGDVHSVSDKPVGLSRPLGCVRKKNQIKLFNSENFRGPDNDSVRFIDTDSVLLPRSWSGNSCRRLTELMANSTPRKDSPNPFQRSKRQIFENRYRLAKARSPTREMKSHSASQYSKRVICLPMFSINLEKCTGWDDNVTVDSARRSLKEIMDKGKKQSANIKNYRFVSPGKEFGEGEEDTPRRLIISNPSKSASSSRQSSARGIRPAPVSVTGSTDTDRMDIKLDSLELASVDDTTYSELDTDSMSPKQGSSIDQTIRRIRKVSDSANSYKYKLTSDNQDSDTQPESEAMWPSYDDIKRLRQNIRQRKSAHRASQMSGSRRLTSSQSTRVSTDKRTISSKSQMKPIVVPTGSVCRQCNLYNNLPRDPTPCPPNSPSLNESRPITSVNVKFSRESTWSDDDEYYPEHKMNIMSRKRDTVNSPRSHKSAISAATQRNAPVKYSQEVLRMPKVTVKMLETKEELQREASKLHNAKVIS